VKLKEKEGHEECGSEGKEERGTERTNGRAKVIHREAGRGKMEESIMEFVLLNGFLLYCPYLGNHSHLQSALQSMCGFVGGVGRPPLFFMLCVVMRFFLMFHCKYFSSGGRQTPPAKGPLTRTEVSSAPRIHLTHDELLFQG
jgi:hypothetical protein